MIVKLAVFSLAAVALMAATPPQKNALIQPRIENGTPIFSTSYAPCYTTIVVLLSNATRICGGCVISPGNKVLTAASCILSTYQNATAANMFFSFGIVYLPNLFFRMTSIAVAPGYSVASNTSSSDLAVVTLSLNATALTANTRVSTLATVATKDAYVGQNLIACGFGVRNRLGTRPIFLNCVTLVVVNTDMCYATAATCATVAPTTTTVATTVDPLATTTTVDPLATTAAPTTAAPTTATTTSPDGVLCTYNTDGRGVCHNDEGGPVFSNSTGTMEQVGVISYVANKNSTLCGNLVVISQVGAFRTFIDGA